MEKKEIVATLVSFDGLSESMVAKLKEKGYYKDQTYEVKEIKNGVVLMKSTRYGEKDTFEVGLENVNLYERFGDDYMVYKPTEEETAIAKEKSEE